MAAHISVREYIRWLPDPAQEPTTTVVLTSPESRFVDVRIFKPIEGQDSDAKVGNVLHTSRLDWAFAGFSSSELRTDPEGKALVHSTWRHWVDSRNENAESVVDEGDMFPQTNGKTLERGSMVNPATGRLTEYEECWIDVEPIPTTASSGGDDSGEQKKVCVVLQLHDDANKARGMVIRLGQFCQGVIRVGEHFSLERWEWRRDGGWKRKARIGSLWVPCGVILEGERLTVGGELRHGEYLWKVVEMSKF